MPEPVSGILLVSLYQMVDRTFKFIMHITLCRYEQWALNILILVNMLVTVFRVYVDEGTRICLSFSMAAPPGHFNFGD